MDILIIKIGQEMYATHKNVQSVGYNKNSNRYVITEEDGSVTTVSKELYMIAILR